MTGAAGFAGSHLVEHLLESVPVVAAWANPGGRHAPGGDGRVRWANVDVLDRDGMARELAELRPSAIYHCAGVAHVAQSWARPADSLRVNALGTHRLFEALRFARLTCPVLLTGSALVYKPSLDAIDEAHPVGPADPYAISKLAQEMVATSGAGVPVLVARPFNHAGPRQSDAFVTSSFARQIAEIEAGVREPVLHVGNLSARRDITDVRDTVRAYRLLVDRGIPGRPYNVCRGEAHAVSELLTMLIAMSSAEISVRTDPARLRPSDNPLVLGSHARITAETGWVPEIPIARTLQDLLNYWRAGITQRP